MSSPFSSFNVEPAFGAFRAVINFTLKAGIIGDTYIYRSGNGVNGWELLNPDSPLPAGTTSFADTDLVTRFERAPYYRGMVDPGGGPDSWLGGPPVATFQFLTARQRRGATAILKREFRKMSGAKTDASVVLHYIPLEDGEAARWYDPETGQIYGVDCPASETDGFGTRFQGGFNPPIQTWARMIQAAPIVENSGADAMRVNDSADLTIRFLSHPIPRKGHLIIFPQADRRYVVEGPITPFFFPGTTVPLAWESPVKLLEPTDDRHRIEIPELRYEPDFNAEHAEIGWPEEG